MMKMYRSFRAALNDPQQSLGSEKDSSSPYTFRNEDTSEELSLLIPNNISLGEMKRHVKHLFDFETDEFNSSSSIWICYPPDGIDEVDFPSSLFDMCIFTVDIYIYSVSLLLTHFYIHSIYIFFFFLMKV